MSNRKTIVQTLAIISASPHVGAWARVFAQLVLLLAAIGELVLGLGLIVIVVGAFVGVVALPFGFNMLDWIGALGRDLLIYWLALAIGTRSLSDWAANAGRQLDSIKDAAQ